MNKELIERLRCMTPDTIGPQAADALEAADRETESAFAMLGVYGVPKERAKSVSNGIMVLVTRMDKERDFLQQEIAALKADAGRYRWLWNSKVDTSHIPVENLRSKEMFDAQIDAERAAPQAATDSLSASPPESTPPPVRPT